MQITEKPPLEYIHATLISPRLADIRSQSATVVRGVKRKNETASSGRQTVIPDVSSTKGSRV